MMTTRIRGSWTETALATLPSWASAKVSYRRWARQRARYRATLRELHSLSDRDLADIGIARTGIERLARVESRRV